MDPSRVGELRAFVDAFKKDPAVLADPSLAFFGDYLQSLGADIPKVTPMDDIDEEDDVSEDDLDMRDPTPVPDELDEDIVESDLELEGDVVEPDHDDTPQKMGDPSVEVTEESRDAAQEAKGMAMEAMSEGKLEEAVEHLTKEILLNPTSAIMYVTRASVFIKMKKPTAAIRDASAALEINPDSAKGYKTRGMANAMLGKWEEAAHDLHSASNIDYDDEISAVLKKVESNAHKIVEHRRKYDRLRKEREEKKAERDRLRRRAETQAAYEKAKKKEQSSRSSGGGFPGGMPGGFPGFGGGMPGGMGGFPGGMGGFPGGMGGGMPAGMGGGMPAGMGSTHPNLDLSHIPPPPGQHSYPPPLHWKPTPSSPLPARRCVPPATTPTPSSVTSSVLQPMARPPRPSSKLVQPGQRKHTQPVAARSSPALHPKLVHQKSRSSPYSPRCMAMTPPSLQRRGVDLGRAPTTTPTCLIPNLQKEHLEGEPTTTPTCAIPNWQGIDEEPNPKATDQIREIIGTVKALNTLPSRTSTLQDAKEVLREHCLTLLNTGSLENLQKLKGINVSRARSIIKCRGSSSFKKVSDLTRVKMKPKQIKAMMVSLLESFICDDEF